MTINPATKMLMEQALASAAPRDLHRVLFNLADCYNQTSAQAFAMLHSKRNADFAAPAIMCKSFAIELLLKFFIAAHYPANYSKADIDAAGGNLRGHFFSELFDRISPTTQTEIAKKHSEQTGVAVTPADFRAILVSLGDDPFVSWRYLYENSDKRHIDFELLTSVVESLGMTAQDTTRRIGGV